MSTPDFPAQPRPLWKDLLHPAVIVGALGYFVDIYDLVLCMAVKNSSLAQLGLTKAAETTWGDPMNWQMLGMLLGGVFFGVIGDRLGRLTTLFGSILLYSLANIANGMVNSLEAYNACRFIGGFGLSGELGGCIALVSEALPKDRRGYGTALVAAVGVFGAVVACFVAMTFNHGDDWRMNYYVGGGLGLALLFLRVGVKESLMFHHASKESSSSNVARGNFFALFTNWGRFTKYAGCIIIGLPTWFMIGILVQNAEKVFSIESKVPGVISPMAVGAFYLGLTFGDLGSGILSQLMKSRKKVVALFLCLSLVGVSVYLYGVDSWSAYSYYALICFMGFGMGYWAIFVTIAAEQFGTNLRSTVATTVPNFVRGSLPVYAAVFLYLTKVEKITPSISATYIAVFCFAAAFLALWKMEETFGKDLDYQEKK
jgi:MFS family permease